MLSKIKKGILITVGIICIHSMTIIRISDDELTFENFFKRENMGLTLIFVVMIVGISLVSYRDKDDDK